MRLWGFRFLDLPSAAAEGSAPPAGRRNRVKVETWRDEHTAMPKFCSKCGPNCECGAFCRCSEGDGESRARGQGGPAGRRRLGTHQTASAVAMAGPAVAAAAVMGAINYSKRRDTKSKPDQSHAQGIPQGRWLRPCVQNQRSARPRLRRMAPTTRRRPSGGAG